MPTNQTLSNCCGAAIIETCGGAPHEGATWWHECTQCKQPCDPQTDVAQRTEQDVSTVEAAGSSPAVSTNQTIAEKEKIIMRAFDVWQRQGRTKEQIYGAHNFMSGTLIPALEKYAQLCREEGRREQREKCLDAISCIGDMSKRDSDYDSGFCAAIDAVKDTIK